MIEEKRVREKIPLYSWIFLVAFFLKQFYTRSSGTIQIGDIAFMVSFLAMLMTRRNVGLLWKSSSLLIFVELVCVIEGVYCILYKNTGFITTALYYIYNLLVVVTFDTAKENKRFLLHFERVLDLCLLLQLVVYITNRGRWFYDARYQGTFNDPNQYGFFILSTFFMIVLLMKARGKIKGSIIWYAVAVLLVVPCASIGMMLGLLIYIVIYVTFSEATGVGKLLRITIILILALIFLLTVQGYAYIPESIENLYIYQRSISKLESQISDSTALIENRGWDIAFQHPWCILYGAGEGAFYRFGSGGEIHNTILTLLWCYGVIPFRKFYHWCRSKLRGISPSVWCVYFALLAESMTLVNHRQPMFWMLIAIADYELLKNPHYLAGNRRYPK